MRQFLTHPEHDENVLLNRLRRTIANHLHPVRKRGKMTNGEVLGMLCIRDTGGVRSRRFRPRRANAFFVARPSGMEGTARLLSFGFPSGISNAPARLAGRRPHAAIDSRARQDVSDASCRRTSFTTTSVGKVCRQKASDASADRGQRVRCPRRHCRQSATSGFFRIVTQFERCSTAMSL